MTQAKLNFMTVLQIVVISLTLVLFLTGHGSAQPDSYIQAQVDDLIEQLKSKDPKVLVNAAKELGGVGPAAKEAVPALIAILKEQKDFGVLLSVVEALGGIGSAAKEAVPALIAVLKKQIGQRTLVESADPGSLNKENFILMSAASALGRIGPAAKEAVPVLIVVLKGQKDTYVLGSVASALGGIGPAAKEAVPALIAVLKDQKESGVLLSVAHALGEIGPAAKEAVPGLIAVLKEENNSGVLAVSAYALMRIGPAAKEAVPVLIAILKEQKDPGVLRGAASALGRIGLTAKETVPALIAMLQEQKDSDVLKSAAYALEVIGPAAKEAVPALIAVLKEQKESYVLGSVASALGGIGPAAKEGVPALIAVLKEQKDLDVLMRTADALGRITQGMPDDAKEEQWTVLDLNREIEVLKSALTIAQKVTPNQTNTINILKRTIDHLDLLRQAHWWDRILDALRDHKVAVGVIGTLFFFALLWPFLLLICPLWLLTINDALAPYMDVTLPPWLGGIKVPLRILLLVNFFHYHPRVLDAWVAAYLKTARDRFGQRATVHARKVHIPIPVEINSKMIADFSSAHLQSLFQHMKICLLIWGEGGAGKTSLACQVAQWGMADDPAERICRHPMLPVLIEGELDTTIREDKRFTETVRGLLQDLTGTPEPISQEFLTQLLRQRRILVIVDHLSEMSETTRNIIRPGHIGFTANALLVTSRLEEPLGQVIKTIIKPSRIAGNRLSSFMEAYLTQCGKRDLFPDAEFFEICRRLSVMVGARDSTVLLAKMYADLVMADKESTTSENLPDNIPDMMLSYLNTLNRSATDLDPNDQTVQRDVQTIAWECLKENYQPRYAKRAAIILALGGENAAARLEYLEHRLHILQTLGSSKENVSFNLDPLAEYMAGLHYVKTYGSNDPAWKDFWEKAEACAPKTILGFLRAVWDACQARQDEIMIPEWVRDKLRARADEKHEKES